MNDFDALISSIRQWRASGCSETEIDEMIRIAKHRAEHPAEPSVKRCAKCGRTNAAMWAQSVGAEDWFCSAACMLPPSGNSHE